MPRAHALQCDKSHRQHRFSEEVMPGGTDLSRAPPSSRGLGLAHWVGLRTGMGVVRRTRTAPDYLHPAAQTEPWPRPGRHRSTRRAPQQKQRGDVGGRHETDTGHFRKQRAPLRLRQSYVTLGAEPGASGLPRKGKGNCYQSLKAWPICWRSFLS